MVFSSVPLFLDPPNWNQQPSHQPVTGGISGGGGEPHQLAAALPPRPEGNIASSSRPGSMADRARLAKVPQPEPGLNCPRCDSTNTKFCYFNNYSLSQPRHFCKTCRRYWTRGGTLRNVPVGGGCRRNKRSKSSGGSKASAAAADRQAGPSSSTAAPAVGISAIASNVPHHPQLPFLAPLHPLADYGAAANVGLSFPGVQHIDTTNFHVGGSSVMGLEQWRLQQVQPFPLSAGLDPPPPSVGLFPFDGEAGAVDGGMGGFAGPVHGKPSASGLFTQLPSVKMERNPQGLNLPRQYLGIPGSDQFWVGGGGGSDGGGNSSADASSGGGGWMDLPAFNSSSTTNIL